MRIVLWILLLSLSHAEAQVDMQQKIADTDRQDVFRVSPANHPWLGDTKFQQMISQKSQTIGEIVRFWQNEVKSGKHWDLKYRWHIQSRIGPPRELNSPTSFTLDRDGTVWSIVLLSPPHGRDEPGISPDKLVIDGRKWTLYLSGSILESGTY
jgi:hypothetical protein